MHVEIREAGAADWPAVRPFFHGIVAAGDTFTHPQDPGAEEARGWWMPEPPDRTVVAVDADGTVVGSARTNRDQGGDGGHIAGAGYMVDPVVDAPTSLAFGVARCSQADGGGAGGRLPEER
ncbi:GNAT family N-acetyltransferase, partial [Streptomyces sp. Act-28]